MNRPTILAGPFYAGPHNPKLTALRALVVLIYLIAFAIGFLVGRISERDDIKRTRPQFPAPSQISDKPSIEIKA
jgi:hypothetical protein